MPASSRKPAKGTPSAAAAAAEAAEEGADGQQEDAGAEADHLQCTPVTSKGRKAAAAAAAAHTTSSSSVADRLADLLAAAVPVLLAPWVLTPPPAAAAFIWGDLPLLQASLAPHPQQQLLQALGQPWARIPSCPQQAGPAWEDPCLAYKLLEQQGGPRGDGLGIAEWFGLFCGAVGLPVGPAVGDLSEDEEGNGRTQRRRR
jgi:hypothetical protein